MDIGEEIRSELGKVISGYRDSWSAQDIADAEECARRAVELGALMLAGKDVEADMRHVRAQSATIAQRAQLKGRDAVMRVVDAVLRRLSTLIVGAIA